MNAPEKIRLGRNIAGDLSPYWFASDQELRQPVDYHRADTLPQWRPIEEIEDKYVGTGVAVLGWDKTFGYPLPMIGDEEGGWTEQVELRATEPSHWQPLPEPPKVEGDD